MIGSLRWLPILATAALIGSTGCTKDQGPAPAAGEKEGGAQVEKNPTHALWPRFVADQTWDVEVKAKSLRTMGETTMRLDIGLKMTARIPEMKDDHPVRMEYLDVYGPQSFSLSRPDEKEKTESRDNRGGTLTGKIDKEYRLHDAKDGGALSDDILLAFPPGPICGFVPPGDPVRVGDTWSSGDVLPVGPKTLRKGDLVFSQVEGQCKLEEASKGMARILWTGSAAVESRGRSSDRATWKVVTLFDLTSMRTERVESSIEIFFPGGIRFLTEVAIESEYAR